VLKVADWSETEVCPTDTTGAEDAVCPENTVFSDDGSAGTSASALVTDVVVSLSSLELAGLAIAVCGTPATVVV
jgi:hypothetical protein